jgi:hypothetical protein
LRGDFAREFSGLGPARYPAAIDFGCGVGAGCRNDSIVCHSARDKIVRASGNFTAADLAFGNPKHWRKDLNQ